MKKSICCGADLIGGVQCECCGADGRKVNKEATPPVSFRLSEKTAQEIKELKEKSGMKYSDFFDDMAKVFEDEMFPNIVGEEDYKVVEAMEKIGGSFVKALAGAFYRADHINFNKLKIAFPEYWTQYLEWSKKR